MFFITKTFNPDKGYSCVFRQHRAKSHCRLAHGYDLQFEVTLGADTLDSNGWVFDFGSFKPLEKAIKDTFDHKWVVADDDPMLDAIGALSGLDIADVVVMPQVGCEAFALWLAQQTDMLLEALQEKSRVRIMQATVREHGANLAGFTPIAEGM